MYLVLLLVGIACITLDVLLLCIPPLLCRACCSLFRTLDTMGLSLFLCITIRYHDTFLLGASCVSCYYRSLYNKSYPSPSIALVLLIGLFVFLKIFLPLLYTHLQSLRLQTFLFLTCF